MADNNESINNEVGFSDSQTESQTNTDSGIQTESLSVGDCNVEESVISAPGANSTPVTSKTKEKEMSMNDLFNLLSKRFDSNDEKFNEQNSKFDGINSRFDNNDVKLNEIKTEIKSEFNCKFEVLKCDINEEKLNAKVVVTN